MRDRFLFNLICIIFVYLIFAAVLTYLLGEIVILFSLGFAGISVMVAATAKSQETFWGIINFLGMPLFMISPALFPLELLPDWLAVAAKLNPVTYTILLIRGLMTGVTEGVSPALSIGIIVVFVLVMVGLASYVFTREVNKPF